MATAFRVWLSLLVVSVGGCTIFGFLTDRPLLALTALVVGVVAAAVPALLSTIWERD